LFLPLNRSVVLGPHETRGINLPCKFPIGSLREYFVTLPNRQVTFLVKTDGVRIWGALKNFSAEPQQLMPRYDLLACRTSVQWFRVPDKGVLLIPEGRKGQGFCILDQSQRALGTIAHVMGTRSEWLATLRTQFAEVFAAGLGTCRTYVVRSFPFRFPLPWKTQPPCRMSGPAEEAKVLEEVLKLVKLGAVREVFHEPYVIPAFGVPKKNGSTRLVLDFRKFNSCVHHQPFLPVNRELSLAALRPFCIGSALDLSNAYLQVRLAPRLWRAVGLAVAGRFFEYTRLPFGYNNSSHEFLRALWPTVRRVSGRIRSQVLFYMDDILLLSQSEDQHRRDMAILLEELARDGWRVNWDKCQFCRDRFEYLGVTLTSSGLEPTDAVLQQFEHASMPTTQTGWRQIRGWLNHSARFIWRGHLVLAALRDVQAQPSQAGWRHFLSLLRRHFIRCAVPSASPGTFTIITDASKLGWGAVLLVGRRVVRCAHGLWSSHFCHHVSNVLELEALCRALRTFRPWVFGAPVHAVMDNQAAVSFNNPANLSDFLKRRLAHLSWSSPHISFCPGPFNYLADFLSRQGAWVSGKPRIRTVEGQHTISQAQWKQAHAGHFGARKTYLCFRQMGLRPTWQWVTDRVRSCRECQLFHRPQPSNPFGSWRIPERPGQVIGLDFMGPFPERKVGKKRFVLVIVDMLTRRAGAWATTGAGGADIVRGLKRWAATQGVPSILCSDVCKATQSKELQGWCLQEGVTQEYSPPYHHASIGFVERFNQTLLNRLRRMWAEEPRYFARTVERAVDIYNNTPLSSPEESKETPSSFVFGSPEQLWNSSQVVWSRLREHARRQREQANHRTRGRRIQRTFRAGDRVWLWNTKVETLKDKLEPWWKGPGQLIRPITTSVWEVRGPEGKLWIRHTDMIRPYHDGV